MQTHVARLPVVQVLRVTLVLLDRVQEQEGLALPETPELMVTPEILVHQVTEPLLVALGLRVMLGPMVTQAQQETLVQVQQRVTPVVRAAQAQMVTQAQQATQALALRMVVPVLRVMLVRQVTQVQQVLRVLVLLRVVQVLRVMLARLVMQGPRATQELALHRAMQDRLMLGVPETPDQRPQLTAQTPQKFGHSSRFRSQLVVGARQGKSPLLGDGPR